MFRQTTFLMITIGLSVVIALSVTSTVVNAQIEFEMDNVSHFGGYIGNAVVQGDYAFINQGTYLTVLDISGPEPEQVATLELPDEPLTFYISGNYLYTLLTNDEGFHIIHISDPLNPTIEGDCDLPEDVGQYAGICVVGDLAFVACGNEGLKIVNVVDPANPFAVGTLVKNFIDVVVQGNYAYAIEQIGVWDSRLWVIDITDPANPTEEGSVETKSSRALDIAGDYVFLAENWQSWGMRVVDISDPENPTSEAFFQTKDGQDKKPGVCIDIEGEYAYLACSSRAWLFIADISNPLNPTEVGKLEIENTITMSYPKAVQVNFPRVYMAIGDMGEGFQVIDVSTPATPSVDKTFESPSTVTWQLTDGDYLYVASVERLWVYDITATPEAPVLVNSYAQWPGLKRLAIKGNTLYGLIHDELYIIDISDPNDLTERSSYESQGGFAYGLAVLGDYVYLLSGFGPFLLEIVDVVDPFNPEAAGVFELPGMGKDVDVSVVDGRHLAYVAYFNDDTDRGFQIVDVTDPASPFSSGSAQTAGRPTCLWRDETGLYVGSIGTSDEWWLEIFDTSVLPTPVQVAQTGGTGEIWDVDVIDGVAFCSVIGASIIAEWYDWITGFFFKLETCPSPGTAQSTVTYPNQSGQGTSYSTEGGRHYGDETGSISGSNGVAVQLYIKPPPSEQDCCISTKVEPQKAADMKCLANPVCAVSECETPVPLVAEPQEDWVFWKWTGAAQGTEENTQSVFRGAVPPGCVGVDPPVCAGWVAVANFTPWLRLSGAATPILCPVIEAEKEISLLPFKLTASNADELEVSTITVEISGDAEVTQHITGARLVWTGGEQEKQHSGAGSIVFQTTDAKVPLGGETRFYFSLKFKQMDNLQCPFEPKELTVTVSPGQVEAEPVNYSPGEVQGTAGGDIIVGCIWNFNKELCYEEIQEAVDQADDGNIIIVCAGDYEENVDVTKKLTIHAPDGPDHTTVRAVEADDHVFHVMKDESVIQGFTVRGATGQGKAGIYVHGSTLKKCEFINNNLTGNTIGMRLDSTEETLFRENRFHNNTDRGLYLQSCINFTFESNSCRDNGSDGLYMENCREQDGNSLIQNSTFSNNGRSGVYVKECNGYTISNSISISDNKLHGAHIENSHDIGVVINPLIQNNSESGIHIVNCQVPAGQTGITVWTNTIEGSKSTGKQQNGIHVENSKGITIGNAAGKNTIINHPQNGIRFLNCQGGETEETAIRVSGNEVKWNSENGIRMNTSCGIVVTGDNIINENGNGIMLESCQCSTPNRITSNTSISSNTKNGIYLESCYNNLISENGEIKLNEDSGINLKNCDCPSESKNTITGNTVQQNKKNGLYIDDSEFNDIKDNNQILANEENGIHVTGSRSIKINGNRFNGTMNSLKKQKNGILMELCGSNMWIEENVIESHLENGIHVLNSGYPHGDIASPIVGNTIKDGKVGILLESSCNIWVGAWADGEDPLLKENTIGPNTEAGIKLSDCNCMYTSTWADYIAGNIIQDNPDGILVHESKGHIIGKSNTIRNSSGNGIHLFKSAGNEIYDNTIGPNNQHGIFVNQCLTTKNSPNEIIGNYIHGNKLHGIYVESSSALTIGTQESKRNNIQKNVQCGIMLANCTGSTESPNSIGYNSIGPNNLYGIYVVNSEGNRIESNEVENNTQNGIHLERSTQNKLYGNFVRENGNAGIMLSYSDENEIGDTYANKNEGSGIHLDNSHRNVIPPHGKLQNTLLDNKEHGIRLRASNYNRFYDNEANENDKDGIHIGYGRKNKFLGKLVIKENGQDGIELHATVLNEITPPQGVLPYPYLWWGALIAGNKGNGIYYNQCRNNTTARCWVMTHGNGFYLRYANNNHFLDNRLSFNTVGAYEKCGKNNNYGASLFTGNTHTIILSGCSHYPSTITGCTITESQGDGITCEYGADPVIHKCNIHSNQGYGLNNLDSSLMIDARETWWGDVSGPGGAGPGSGDEVSDGVDFFNWRTTPVSFIVVAWQDTVVLPGGVVDSVVCYLQNWSGFDDSFTVTVTADSTTWITGPVSSPVAIEDSAGGETVVHLSIPPGTAPGAFSTVRVHAAAQTQAGLTDADSFLVMVYAPSLAALEVQPDTTLLRAGYTQQFTAQGYDSTDQSIEVDIQWDATGGIIDSTGFYFAGGDTGTFQVVVGDFASTVSDSAIVLILPELYRIDVSPDSIELNSRGTQQFTAQGYDSAGSEVDVYPQWSATTGDIDSQGFFTAGGDSGIFFVSAMDQITGTVGLARVHISISVDRGDANCDGTITPGDALCCFWRSILGDFQTECICVGSEDAADVNCDGTITPGDALCIFWRSILGDWTEECDCQFLTKTSVSENTSSVRAGTIMALPGDVITVPLLVEKPANLDAFGLQLVYPAHLLEFKTVSPSPATRGWTVVDGKETEAGLVSIGGFHTLGITSEDTRTIAEVSFIVRQEASGSGEIDLINLVDDLANATVVKGNIRTILIPRECALHQNYPNPFNPSTDIRYQISSFDSRLLSFVSLKIFNILGQEIKTLVDENMEAGYYIVTWNGTDNNGSDVASGIYFYRIEAGEYVNTKRMLLIK